MGAPEQSKADREYILANLPSGTRRVQVINASGKQEYKRPEDVDPDVDEISVASDGTPIVMKKKPGRPSKIKLNPPTPQLAEMAEARDSHLMQDDLLREVQSNTASDDTFDQIVEGMAREAAQIEFERMELQRNGQEYSTVASRRARILKSMAELVLARQRQQRVGTVDLESPAFKAVFGLMLETFKDAMRDSGARGELVETTFTNLVKALNESWKQEARRRMKDASQ
jgi:hypothetical protein